MNGWAQGAHDQQGADVLLFSGKGQNKYNRRVGRGPGIVDPCSL